MQRLLFAPLFVFLFAAGPVWSDEVPHVIAPRIWDEGLGAHRAVVHVDRVSEAVLARVPWRRRDHDPDKKAVIVVDATTGKQITNVVCREMSREAGTVVFQPVSAPGDYGVYYLPYVPQPGWGGYGGGYVAPRETADASWRDRLPQDLSTLPRAAVRRFESRTAFDSFDPMEIVATAEEVEQLLARYQQAYLVFPEDRLHPIRMTDDLPLRWIRTGPADRFEGEVLGNEYYAFQIGLFAARQELQDVSVEFSGPAAAWLHCFNCGGVDSDGKSFTRNLRVPQGRIQALWLGADIPRTAEPGDHQAVVTVRPRNAPPAAVSVTLHVLPRQLPDRGDGEPWRHSRLRWLDSQLGMDDEVVAPYGPLDVQDTAVCCLGRVVQFGQGALPQNIRCGDIELLADAVRFLVEGEQGGASSCSGAVKLIEKTAGHVTWEAPGTDGPVSVHGTARMEFDGHISFRLKLSAREAVKARDVRLEIPLRAEAATYLMGIGQRAVLRPAQYTWKWQGPYDSLWIGDVHAGLHCELRGGPYHGPMLNLYPPSRPASWYNDGKGGVSLADGPGGRVHLCIYSGERELKAGQSMEFEFALLPTPVKPLDTARHFRERYYHHTDPDPDFLAAGVNVINVHHATRINPFINYPFLTADVMRPYVRQWHDRKVKVKFYYTVRELSNHVVELWALRSLGSEVLCGGPGGGFPWLREHLGADYTPQWYNVCADGVTIDAALLTAGTSRWYNYYVEGLSWLVDNIPIDGLYLDDVTYDRRILKRMRKVVERHRPGCLIDLHSNTKFSIGPANQYAEFFPFVDRLWFGEGFDYDSMTPAQWLVEASGLPFGLMSDMLQDGGNRWLGVVYGMTARAPAGPDPRPVWKLWDDFGIADAKMIGYWEKACPVRTDHPDVLATAYVKADRTLVALASWAGGKTGIRLRVDWQALGLNPAEASLYAPAVPEFQPAQTWGPADTIEIEPRRGWLIWLGPRSGSKP